MLGTGQQGQVNWIIFLKGNEQSKVGVTFLERTQKQLGQPPQATCYLLMTQLCRSTMETAIDIQMDRCNKGNHVQ